MSDHISRAKLFDKLATVNGEDANDMKAKIYAVIQEMETEPDLRGDWVKLHDHISKNMEQLRLQVRESMARISESIREAMQGIEPTEEFEWCYHRGYVDAVQGIADEMVRRDLHIAPNNSDELNAYRMCVESRSFWDHKHCDGCCFDERCPFD